VLIILFGLPGTGKTTIARALAAQLHAAHFNSDTVRSALGLMGHYTEGEKQRVYQHLMDDTRAALSEGKTVVVDGTFYKEAVRTPFRLLAQSCGVRLCWVEVATSEAVLRERLQHPRSDSEADFEVYVSIRDQFEPLLEDHLTVHTDKMMLPDILQTICSFYL
jgi:predicted kinase